MIVKIKGIVDEIVIDGVLLDVQGVVYKAIATQYTCSTLRHGQEITLLTHLDIKENSHTLYGFLYVDEKEIFELLLQVNGVGPKSAISILNSSNPKTILEGIGSRDAEYFKKLTGIGLKTAEKIIVALKDKVEHIQTESNTDKQDALEALIALGYSKKDARDAITGLSHELNSNEIIKEALKILAR
ncbi:MAG: Holliday junction branch migration protein RuvA [Candidatus Parcubacteria bacterium]|jgi:Holliday junction DNA helicase RuvA